ncbi:hypothetical protein D3C80_982380 [compost metagenome]
MLVALPIDGMNLDDALGGLAAICAGIHPQGATDRARNTVIEGKAADTVIHGHRGNMLVRADRTGTNAVFADKLNLAESLGRKAHDNARNAAVTNEKVRAHADNRQRHFGRQQFQEGYQIVHVMRLEHQFRQTARLEPGYPFHRCVRCKTPAQLVHALPERGQQLFPIYLLHTYCPDMLSSSLGNDAAHCVILPAPRRTTKSPGFAMPETICASSAGDAI